MLIDVRHSVHLGVPARRAVVTVPTPKPAPGTAFAARRLTLRGTPVFELNLWCGTCPALFKKLTQPEAADVGLATELLNAGLEGINDEVLRVYSRVLPRSRYTVLLLEVTPELVRPGGPADYFSHEQVITWGVDPVVGAPDDPGTAYYRTFEAPIIGNRHLYEFVVPMVPPAWNNTDRVAQYSAGTGRAPATAVAYALLDVLQPAIDEGEDYYTHWVLTHFLLDGHHKIEAAATIGGPVRILSFVDERVSIAATEDLTTLHEARSRPRQARR